RDDLLHVAYLRADDDVHPHDRLGASAAADRHLDRGVDRDDRAVHVGDGEDLPGGHLVVREAPDHSRAVALDEGGVGTYSNVRERIRTFQNVFERSGNVFERWRTYSNVSGTYSCVRGTHSCVRSEEHTSELQSPYDLVCR